MSNDKKITLSEIKISDILALPANHFGGPIYRPALNPIIDALQPGNDDSGNNKNNDDVYANLFLSQVIYWWEKMGRRAFFKYITPPANNEAPYYSPENGNVSWQEELGFSEYHIRRAIKKIAIRTRTGGKKTAALENGLVLYWTNNYNVTKWELNEALLLRKIAELYPSVVYIAGGDVYQVGGDVYHNGNLPHHNGNLPYHNGDLPHHNGDLPGRNFIESVEYAKDYTVDNSRGVPSESEGTPAGATPPSSDKNNFSAIEIYMEITQIKEPKAAIVELMNEWQLVYSADFIRKAIKNTDRTKFAVLNVEDLEEQAARLDKLAYRLGQYWIWKINGEDYRYFFAEIKHIEWWKKNKELAKIVTTSGESIEIDDSASDHVKNIGRRFVAWHLAQQQPEPQPEPQGSGQSLKQLTDRQREVYNGLVEGMTFGQIGQNLGISTSGVQQHYYNITRRVDIAELISGGALENKRLRI